MANRICSTTSSVTGLISSRRSWTPGIWNWATSAWNSRGRDDAMAEQTIQPEQVAVAGPELHRTKAEPKGVMRKNVKVWIFLGASAVVVAAAMISTYGKKPPGRSSTSQHEAPQPAIQDNTDNNVQELKNQLAAERQKDAQVAAAQSPLTNDAALAGGTPAQQAVAAAYGPTGQATSCTPGQPCQQQGGYAQPQLSPQQERAQQLAARERELAYNARFASNLVYTHSSDAQAPTRTDANSHLDDEAQTAVSQPQNQTVSSLVSTREASE